MESGQGYPSKRTGGAVPYPGNWSTETYPEHTEFEDSQLSYKVGSALDEEMIMMNIFEFHPLEKVERSQAKARKGKAKERERQRERARAIIIKAMPMTPGLGIMTPKTRSSHTDFRDWWPDISRRLGLYEMLVVLTHSWVLHNIL